jgi:hypothetical protein
VIREFHPMKPISSLFLETMLRHQKCLCGSLLNTNKTTIQGWPFELIKFTSIQGMVQMDTRFAWT